MIGPIVKLRFSRSSQTRFGLEFSGEQLKDMERVFGEGSLGNVEEGVRMRLYVLGTKGLVLAPATYPIAMRMSGVDNPYSAEVFSKHKSKCDGGAAARVEDYYFAIGGRQVEQCTTTLGMFGGSPTMTSFISYGDRQWLHIPLPEEKDRVRLRSRPSEDTPGRVTKAQAKASSEPPPTPVLKVTGPLVGTVEAVVNFPARGGALKQVLLDIPLEEAIDLVRQYGRRE